MYDKRNKWSLIHNDIVSLFAEDMNKYVIKLSNENLNETQKEELSVGITFRIPPKRIN